jgi:hypothetical protein
MSNSPWAHHRSASIADDIDFEIKGQELQFLEIELDPAKVPWPKPERLSGKTPRST